MEDFVLIKRGVGQKERAYFVHSVRTRARDSHTHTRYTRKSREETRFAWYCTRVVCQKGETILCAGVVLVCCVFAGCEFLCLRLKSGAVRVPKRDKAHRMLNPMGTSKRMPSEITMSMKRTRTTLATLSTAFVTLRGYLNTTTLLV